VGKPGAWTEKEIELLKMHYVSTPIEILRQLLPTKSPNAIQKKAFSLGLKKIPLDKWTDIELANLIRLWPTATKEIIQETLPRHSWLGIKCKASLLGLKKLSAHDRPILSGRIFKSHFKPDEGERFRFAIVSDTHFGSVYAQITYLHDFYRLLEKRNINTVFHAGDLSDGNGTHFPGQRFEMHIHGADKLRNFIIKNYPRLKNGKTFCIAGWHDLDLWTKEGYDLLEKVCEHRDDIVYLGQNDAYYLLGTRKIYIIHPGGGTSYALSYRPQKLVESFSSENKPHIIIVGHFHKAEWIPALRNVYVFQAGCWQYQTPFAIRKNLQFHYGGWIVEMTISKRGISAMKTEFIPFYRFIPNDYRNYE
jgi:predicted phosphodiesterase